MKILNFAWPHQTGARNNSLLKEQFYPWTVRQRPKYAIPRAASSHRPMIYSLFSLHHFFFAGVSKQTNEYLGEKFIHIHSQIKSLFVENFHCWWMWNEQPEEVARWRRHIEMLNCSGAHEWLVVYSLHWHAATVSNATCGSSNFKRIDEKVKEKSLLINTYFNNNTVIYYVELEPKQCWLRWRHCSMCVRYVKQQKKIVHAERNAIQTEHSHCTRTSFDTYVT